MQLVIVTGMSGAGKTLAIRAFEDLGFFCVDNLPPKLLPDLRKLCERSEAKNENIAAVVDVRSGELFDGLVRTYPKIRDGYKRARLLFLDASDEVLIQRFKETRRRHPLFDRCHGILDSIATERKILVDLKELADKVIDTSDLDPGKLKSEIVTYFGTDSANAGLIITVTSFGFKYGLPLDADIVLDVRFLINPHYVQDFRTFDGRDQPVYEYVMKDARTREFMQKLYDLVDFSLPQYENEGKAYLNIAIGCTGGQHRSVVIANELADFLEHKGYRTIIEHRDVTKR
ncbi:MAG TPA: RNase adapter RapZ [Armatimonadota bacterium]|nr:RNase adapter RapZ [Armatimonadota bacterium]